MLFGLVSPTVIADFVAYVESTGNFGPVVYAIAFFIATVACLPSSIIEIVSGFLFPFPIALTVNLSAKFSGAVAAFVLGQTACKGFVSRRAEKLQLVRAMRTALKTHSNAFKLALLLRLSPAPIFVKNYGLGALELSLANFMGATALSALPMGVVWVLVGSAARDAGGELMDLVGEDQSSMDKLPGTTKAILLGVGVVIMGLFGFYVNKTLKDIIGEETQSNTGEEGEGRGKSKTS